MQKIVQDSPTPKPENEPQPILIRPLETSDADAVASLCGQLGYPCSASELYPRIEQILRSAERAAFAAILDGQLAGWIDASVEHHLHASDRAVIGGLVVDESLRGHGVGRRLCKAVEEWAQSRGLSILRVRSQTKREGAHRFYQKDGYERIKTSAVFEKKLV